VRLLVVATLLSLAACGDGGGPPHTHPLWADGAVLRDDQGRVAVLRGINARVDGVFDVSFTDGRAPVETVPKLTAADCTRMRQLGFDLIRLLINWSGVEPTMDHYDDAYLAKVDAAVQCAAGAGMLVVLDLHQDAYSKEIGEDGAPLWAIQPPPTMLLGGPLDDLAARTTSMQTQAAYETFFTIGDASGLQARFDTMLGHVAARWADDPAVVGVEIYNEPFTGLDELAAFHPGAARAIRAAAPDKLAFFEPPKVRNILDAVAKSPTPFAVDGAVYSPHIYTSVDLKGFDPGLLEPSVTHAQLEAKAWKTPMFIGEFAVGPDDDAGHALWTQTEYQLHDRALASNAYWLWKEQSQGSWGLFDHDALTDAWTERPAVIRWVSRVHAARIAGTPTMVESSVAGDSIHIEIAAGSATRAPNVIYVPERMASAFHARCDGADVAATRDPASGLIEVACGGVLDVGP
jgi:endoglycosylceramidase